MAEKRKAADSDIITAPSYRRGAPEKIKAEFKPSKSAFGGTSAVFTNADGSSIQATTPWCELAYEPSAWDDTKQMKYGKDKDKLLDPKRKSDKWNAEMKVNEELFNNYLSGLKAEIARVIYEQRDRVWPDGSKKALKSPDSLDALFEAMLKWDEKSGSFIFKPDIRSDVGAKEVPVPVIDIISGEEMSFAKLGRGTQICATIDFGSGYINKSIKVYATPISFFVRNVVAPRVRDPSKVKPELDD
jgi:hypothetical protein